jgi:integrase/recombinase XerD
MHCVELLYIENQHVVSKRNLVIIKNSKGNKDRIVPLIPKILDMLRDDYNYTNQRIIYLKDKQVGMPYDQRSLQLVLKQALKKSGILKPVPLQWLRYSYATHLLENGTNLRYIQSLLGHASSKTTEIYTHITTKGFEQLKSPIDSLDI